MTQLTNEIYAIEAPEGGCQFQIYRAKNSYDAIVYYDSEPSFNNIRDMALPAGNWQLIGTTKEATKEQAIQIVGSSDWFFPVRHKRYLDYAHPWDSADNKQAWSIGFGDPLESLRSLIVAKGLDLEKNYVIVKKQ